MVEDFIDKERPNTMEELAKSYQRLRSWCSERLTYCDGHDFRAPPRNRVDRAPNERLTFEYTLSRHLPRSRAKEGCACLFIVCESPTLLLLMISCLSILRLHLGNFFVSVKTVYMFVGYGSVPLPPLSNDVDVECEP
jgi:hypothetical protein